jgi:hypothetical protein
MKTMTKIKVSEIAELLNLSNSQTELLKLYLEQKRLESKINALPEKSEKDLFLQSGRALLSSLPENILE